MMTQLKKGSHFDKSRREFLFPETLDRNLFCSICMEVYEQPSRLLCGHTFCHKCIRNWAEAYHKRECPLCKADFSQRAFEKDFSMRKLIDPLIVKCMFSECKWNGAFSMAKRHEKRCEFNEKRKNMQSQVELCVIDDDCFQVVMVDKKELKFDNPKDNWTLTYCFSKGRKEGSEL